jgi:PIN domain nuclease of toxin-antitoxin system
VRLLLDTHVLLWWLDDSPRLSPAVRERLIDPETLVASSVVSLWEIEIKRALGKLSAPSDVIGGTRDAGVELLGVSADHAVEAGRLPLLHRDPFDRMIVAQAQHEGLTVVTGDRRITDYQVPVLPAEA